MHHREDTTPSPFDRAITSSVQPSHDPKRANIQTPEQTTIVSLIASSSYTDIEQFVQDVDTATSSVVTEIQSTIDNGGLSWKARQDANAGLSFAKALQKRLDQLVRNEMIRRPDFIKRNEDVKTETLDDTGSRINTDISRDNVLSLFGQAEYRPAKQLFSSARKGDGLQQPLSDLTLPNGISTTKVIPQHSINEGQKPPTLKETFAPPVALPSLPIPKQSRHTSTRSSSVNWYNPAEADSTKKTTSRRESFTTQPLSTGQWLSYNVAPSPAQLASPESKRKQRDRALSFGEPQSSISPEVTVAHNEAKENALFRSVYSSFAPDRDDSGAMIPEQQKNRLWWAKYGESRYCEILDARDTLNDGLDEGDTNGTVADEINEEELQEAIMNWKPEEAPRSMPSQDDDTEAPKKDADELLHEISDLLETLNSHQRVRNLTLTANSRQSQQSGTATAGPTIPSEVEIDVYETLKDQLTLIVSTLPPYMLAKLDGDKLNALKISTKIPIEIRNSKGTMEEGEIAAAARAARVPAPAATSTSTAYPNGLGASSNLLRGAATTPAQAYNRTAYGSSTVPRPAASSYLQNPQYSNRPAVANYSSSASRSSYPIQSGYAAQPAAASAARYNYGQTYGQQPQSSSANYQGGYRPYSGQHPSNYSHNGQYSTPQPRTGAQASQYKGSQTDYQQRAVPPQGYGYGSAPPAGSASPQNTQRSSYPAQSQTPVQQRPQLYHQPSSHQSQPPASPQVNGTAARASGSPIQQGHLSTEEQATFMEKQKAQLADRARSQSRQPSGTPQPAGEGQNGTSVPQQNGIAA